jgi:hypothetical protein
MVTVEGTAPPPVLVTFTRETYAVTFTENGIPSGRTWSVSLNGNTSGAIAGTTTSMTFQIGNGTFSYVWGNTPGYHITVGTSTGSVTVNGAAPPMVSVTFTATASPAITVSPTQGPVGSSVTVSGTGFSVSTALHSLVFDSVTMAACTTGSLTTGGTGAFSCTFAVPGGTSGTTVTAMDAGDQTATATFAVTTPAITLSPTRGPVGSTVTVSGTGFSVLIPVASLVFDSVTIVEGIVIFTACTSGSLIADGTGAFSCAFAVPSGTSGTTVTATDVGGQTATGTFTVAVNPAITVNPLQGSVGSAYTVTGTGFSVSSEAHVVMIYPTTFQTPTGVSGGSCVFTGNSIATTASGGFVCTFTVPNVSAGTYYLYGEDGPSGVVSSFVTFTVTLVNPAITVSPSQGPVGSTYTVTGTGFSISSGAELFFGAPGSLQTPTGVSGGSCVFRGTAITTTDEGGFVCAFAVPSVSAGRYTLVANDFQTDLDVSTFFWVLSPAITVNPSQGSVGATYTVTGTGFSVSSGAEVVFGGALQTPIGVSGGPCIFTGTAITTTALGGFVCTFAVPSLSAGSYNVQGDDFATDVPTPLVPFTVTTVSAYAVTFMEGGIPKGTSWSVTLNGGTVSSTSSSVSFTEPSGAYFYTVKSSSSSWGVVPDTGIVTVAGAAVSVGFLFLPVYPVTFCVGCDTPSSAQVDRAFLATDALAPTVGTLPPGTVWYVNVTGTPSSEAAVGVGTNGVVTLSYSGNGTTITFSLPNGTWTYTVGSSDPSWASGIPPSALTVSGAAPPPVPVAFVAAYAVTFTETGLGSGTSWSVTLGGTTKNSTSTTITFYEPNATYAFTVGGVSGYTPSPSTGGLTVQGGATPSTIAFSSTSSSSPIPWWAWVAIAVVIVVVVGVVSVRIMRRRPPGSRSEDAGSPTGSRTSDKEPPP